MTQKEVILRAYAQGVPQFTIAKALGVSRQFIHQVVRGRKRRAANYRLYNRVKAEKGVCETCGCKGALQIHHRDGNWRNDNLGNLAVLCRKCHLEAHRSGMLCETRKERGKRHQKIQSDLFSYLESYRKEKGLTKAEWDW